MEMAALMQPQDEDRPGADPPLTPSCKGTLWPQSSFQMTGAPGDMSMATSRETLCQSHPAKRLLNS